MPILRALPPNTRPTELQRGERMDEEKTHQSPQGAQSLDLSSAIERLMANPELISMVASSLGMTKKEPSDTHPTASPAPIGVPVAAPPQAPPSVPALSTDSLGVSPDAIAALTPLLGMLSGKGGASKKDDDRACLLRALKPYVSRGRCEAIDTILQLSRLSDMLRHMNTK